MNHSVATIVFTHIIAFTDKVGLVLIPANLTRHQDGASGGISALSPDPFNPAHHTPGRLTITTFTIYNIEGSIIDTGLEKCPNIFEL